MFIIGLILGILIGSLFTVNILWCICKSYDNE